MFDGEIDHLLGSMDAIEALRELSGNHEQAVIAARASERIELQTQVVVRPGNASQRGEFAYETVTVDISDGGCMLLSPAAVLPGDIYWLEFTDDQVRLGAMFGRCLRSRFVREGVYELGMKFMAPIDLRSAISAPAMLAR
jgi:c-di-GMP-binding flagellar brake protein YcgR